jgi:enterobactin synthetase component D
MFLKLPNPSILSGLAAHHSFRFQAQDIDVAELARLGVRLPTKMEKVVPKRQLEYLIGRYAATLACRDAGAVGDVEIAMSSDRSPIWPLGLVGSITHADGFVSAAVADSKAIRSLGIDSEKIMTAKTLSSIGKMVASESERAIGRLIELSESEMITLLFSAKESIYKSLYPMVNCFFDFDDVEIYRIDGHKKHFFFRLNRDLSSEFCVGFCGTGRFVFEKEYVHTAVEVPPTSR